MYASVKYWVWLADLLPPAAGHRVYAFFQSPTEAFLADNGRYDLIPGLTRQQRELLCHASLDRAEQIVEECARQGIRVVTWQDADYPERLRSTPTPPLVVYAKGRACHFDDEAAIAIAGTRRASPYGKRMAWDIASELTRMGVWWSRASWPAVTPTPRGALWTQAGRWSACWPVGWMCPTIRRQRAGHSWLRSPTKALWSACPHRGRLIWAGCSGAGMS